MIDIECIKGVGYLSWYEDDEKYNGRWQIQVHIIEWEHLKVYWISNELDK